MYSMPFLLPIGVQRTRWSFGVFTFLGSPVCSFNVINTQSHCFLASVVAAETSVAMLTLALGYDLSFFTAVFRTFSSVAF